MLIKMKIRSKAYILTILLFLSLTNLAWGQHFEKGEFLPVVIGTLIFFVLAVLYVVFVFFIIAASKTLGEGKEEFFLKFALSHGFGFHKKDIFKLSQELEKTPFGKIDRDPGDFLKNIITHSDYNSDHYVFYRYIPSVPAVSAGQAYTVCLFKVKEDFDLNLILKARSPVIFEKVEHSLRWGNFKRIDIAGQDEFNREFIIYADKEAVARSLINKEIIEYCRTHRKSFGIPDTVYVEIKHDKLFIYVQHRGFGRYFKDESQLEDFLNLAKDLKEKFLESIL